MIVKNKLMSSFDTLTCDLVICMILTFCNPSVGKAVLWKRDRGLWWVYSQLARLLWPFHRTLSCDVSLQMSAGGNVFAVWLFCVVLVSFAIFDISSADKHRNALLMHSWGMQMHLGSFGLFICEHNHVQSFYCCNIFLL